MRNFININEHIQKEAVFNDYAGSEKKRTVIMDDGKQYMLKFPDPTREINNQMSYINNAISEYLGCKVFASAGIPVQNVYLGTYSTPTKSAWLMETLTSQIRISPNLFNLCGI